MGVKVSGTWGPGDVKKWSPKERLIPPRHLKGTFLPLSCCSVPVTAQERQQQEAKGLSTKELAEKITNHPKAGGAVPRPQTVLGIMRIVNGALSPIQSAPSTPTLTPPNSQSPTPPFSLSPRGSAFLPFKKGGTPPTSAASSRAITPVMTRKELTDKSGPSKLSEIDSEPEVSSSSPEPSADVSSGMAWSFVETIPPRALAPFLENADDIIDQESLFLNKLRTLYAKDRNQIISVRNILAQIVDLRRNEKSLPAPAYLQGITKWKYADEKDGYFQPTFTLYFSEYKDADIFINKISQSMDPKKQDNLSVRVTSSDRNKLYSELGKLFGPGFSAKQEEPKVVFDEDRFRSRNMNLHKLYPDIFPKECTLEQLSSFELGDLELLIKAFNGTMSSADQASWEQYMKIRAL